MSEFEKVLRAHFKNLSLPSSNNNVYQGYVDGEECYHSFLTGLNAIGFLFVTRSSRSFEESEGRIHFKRNAYTKSQHEVSIPFFGSPFQVVKSIRLQCAQGEKYCKPRIMRSIKLNQDETDKEARKQRCAKPTTKFGCPAFLSMKCIRVFDEPQYKLAFPACYGVTKIVSQLREDVMKKSPSPTSFLRFIIMLSPPEIHSHTTASTSISHLLHPKLKEEINRLAHGNISSVKTVKSYLIEFVRTMFIGSHLPRPDSTNKYFYPTDKVIRNHIHFALDKLKRSRFDENSLRKHVETWKEEFPEDNFFFRPCKTRSIANGDETNNSTVLSKSKQSALLFCHQTKWQCNLLSRYGNDVSLLDPAYKTVKYCLPLYFIIVKTNCGHAIVGTFIVYDESSTLISEALAMFTAWNPEWSPKFFVTDFSEADVTAVIENFPRTVVYYSLFHREQTWDRWLQKSGRVPSGEEQKVKRLWCNVADSMIEEDYQANVLALNCDEMLKHQCPIAKTYFAQKWLICPERWVLSYQASEFLSILNINNGVETEKTFLKHTFLRFSSTNTLSELLTMIIMEFLQQCLKNYCISNTSLLDSIAKEFNAEMPTFLYNKTNAFVLHVKDSYNNALRSYDIEKILSVSGSEGEFYVKSENQESYYTVSFETAMCTCSHFLTWRFPCKHMCALFIYTYWSYEKLPVEYRESPYITIDTNYISDIVHVHDCITPLGSFEESVEESMLPNEIILEVSNNTSSQVLEEKIPLSEVPAPLETTSGELLAANAKLLETRLKLKRLLRYTYRMESTHHSTQEFCDKVGMLEAETWPNLKRVKVLKLQPVLRTTKRKVQLVNNLPKCNVVPSNQKITHQVLRAVGRVVTLTNRSQHGAGFKLDVLLPVDKNVKS